MKQTAILLPMLALAMAACSQEDAPSEQVKKAGQDIVEAVEGTSSSPPAQAQGPYAPRNECDEETGAKAFLAKLNRAAEERDEDALVALAAEDIKLDFGGGSGTEELRRRLAGEHGNLWPELEELTTLGCAVNSTGGITMPWYFAQKLPVESYRGAIVTGENVPLRSAPGGDAPVVARLSWEAVEIVTDQPPLQGWTQVRLPAAGEREQPPEGYITSDRLRSILGHRLIAASRNNRWRITSLVAGD